MAAAPGTDVSPDRHWISAIKYETDHDPQSADSIAATVAAAAVVEAEQAALAVVQTQAAVLAAARTVAAAAAAAAAEARRVEARLTHDVLHDELTGLANRRLLVDRLAHGLARSTRAGTSVVVLFLDLDGFKAVNDTLGHAAGDQLLVGVARRLQESLRDIDTCARVGGDEFVIIAEDVTEPSYGATLAERLRGVLAAGVPIGEQTIPVKESVGITVSTPTSLPFDLLEDADTAM